MQIHSLYSSTPSTGGKAQGRARQVFNFHIRTSVDSFTLSQTWLTLAIGPYQFNFGAKPEQQNHQTHSYAVLVPKLKSILVRHKTF